jgi:hypothetical protein
MENKLIKQLAELNDKYQEVKAENGVLIQTIKDVSDLYYDAKIENERLKETVEHIRRCMVGWKSHLHPDLLTLKTIDKILIEHSNH